MVIAMCFQPSNAILVLMTVTERKKKKERKIHGEATNEEEGKQSAPVCHVNSFQQVGSVCVCVCVVAFPCCRLMHCI